ncbi:MAG: hypothetical protein AAGD14_01490 [Planctomycetota bacterium]
MRRAVVLLVALLIASVFLGRALRAERPPTADVTRIGVGPLLGSVLTGAFRPLLMNYLFIRADVLAGQGRFDEQVTLFRTMVQLYPNNEAARGFLGWHLAFNAKQEAPDAALAWRWAREGLDILVDIESERRTVAYWFAGQCGQNRFEMFRYAGRAWEAERAMRKRALDWAERTWGRPIARFEAALIPLEGLDELPDRALRMRMHQAALFDDWMRTGESTHLAPTIEGLEWLADVFEGLPEERDIALKRAAMLKAIEAGTFVDSPAAEEDEANALWALGMHRRDVRMLKTAFVIFDRLEFAPFMEELDLINRWIQWIEGGELGVPPPMPFDSP